MEQAPAWQDRLAQRPLPTIIVESWNDSFRVPTIR